MNNYIVDPAVFYWINTLGNISSVCAIVGVIACLAAIVFTIIYLFLKHDLDVPVKPEDESDKWDMDHYKRDIIEYNRDKAKANIIRNWAIATAVAACVLLIIAVFVPSKSTSIEMLVAKTATFDNVNWTVQQVKEVIDYITSSLKGVV